MAQFPQLTPNTQGNSADEPQAYSEDSQRSPVKHNAWWCMNTGITVRVTEAIVALWTGWPESTGSSAGPSLAADERITLTAFCAAENKFVAVKSATLPAELSSRAFCM